DGHQLDDRGELPQRRPTDRDTQHDHLLNAPRPTLISSSRSWLRAWLTENSVGARPACSRFTPTINTAQTATGAQPWWGVLPQLRRQSHRAGTPCPHGPRECVGPKRPSLGHQLAEVVALVQLERPAPMLAAIGE